MKELLQDYRCECGKLLLKGLVLSGMVEIKCRYCKKLQSIYGLVQSGDDPRRFFLLVDKTGTVLKASGSLLGELGYDSSALEDAFAHSILVPLSPNASARIFDMLDARGKSTALFSAFASGSSHAMVPVLVCVTKIVHSGGPCLLFDVQRKSTHNRMTNEVYRKGASGE